MKLLLGILFLVALAAVVVLSIRRGAGDVGYRRRFESRYRRDRRTDDAATDTSNYTPMFIAGATDHGAHSHSHADCGSSVGHADGGAGCDGGN